jgi:hypothetical protein
MIAGSGHRPHAPSARNCALSGDLRFHSTKVPPVCVKYFSIPFPPRSSADPCAPRDDCPKVHAAVVEHVPLPAIE